jgi:hypothetical protein
MKINAALAKSLLLAISTGCALPLLAKPPAKPGPAPAKQEETAKPEGEEAEGVIQGVSAPRKNGGFIGITVDEGGFKLSFYDKKKKPVDCDVARAVVRWNPSYKIGEERRMLNPSGDGKTLTSPPVRAPYNFRFVLVLLDESGEAVESFPALKF